MEESLWTPYWKDACETPIVPMHCDKPDITEECYQSGLGFVS